MYYGNQTKFNERHFDPFPGLPNVSDSVDTIEIKWVRIDGPNLTSALTDYYPNVKKLHLNNVTIEGLLEPTTLNSLEEFYLNQGLQPEEQNNTKYQLGMIQKEHSWLDSTLFFLNINSTDWVSKAVYAYTRGINVTVYLKGSVAFQLNPGAEEVRLDINTCSSLLDALPKTYKSVTLGRCDDLRANSLSPSVTILNLYIVYMTSDLLSGMLRNLPNLETFSAEIPDKNVEIDLSDFQDKIKVISVSSMNIKPNLNVSLPSVKEFYFGSENQYSWLPNRVTTLNNTLYDNFARIFPNIERVGLFDLEDENRYELLSNVMNIKSVKWLLVENFARISRKNETVEMKNLPDSVKSVEDELTRLGLNKYQGDFLIQIVSGGVKTIKETTKLEKLWYRYNYLGWRPIDSWPKYTYVQKLIDNGELL
jgi:hypothetical protein